MNEVIPAAIRRAQSGMIEVNPGVDDPDLDATPFRHRPQSRRIHDGNPIPRLRRQELASREKTQENCKGSHAPLEGDEGGNPSLDDEWSLLRTP